MSKNTKKDSLEFSNKFKDLNDLLNDVDISPKIYSRKEFSELKKKDRSFIRNVMREGVILWQMS